MSFSTPNAEPTSKSAFRSSTRWGEKISLDVRFYPNRDRAVWSKPIWAVRPSRHDPIMRALARALKRARERDKSKGGGYTAAMVLGFIHRAVQAWAVVRGDAMALSNEQIDALKQKVNKLAGDKAAADALTQASNQADTDAANAAATAAQAKLDESAADAQVAADLSDLVTFVEGLAAPATA